MNTYEKIEKTILFLLAVPLIWYFYNKLVISMFRNFYLKKNPEILKTGFWTFAKVFFRIFSIVAILMCLYIAISFWI